MRLRAGVELALEALRIEAEQRSALLRVFGCRLIDAVHTLLAVEVVGVCGRQRIRPVRTRSGDMYDGGGGGPPTARRDVRVVLSTSPSCADVGFPSALRSNRGVIASQPESYTRTPSRSVKRGASASAADSAAV